MKTIRTILATAAVSASLVMAGCDLKGGYSGSTTFPLMSSIEETTGGIKTLTEYTYDDDYLTRAEKLTVGGKVVHEDTGYERDDELLTITYYRKFFAEDGTTVDHTHKRVMSYANPYARECYKLEVFDMADEAVPVEYWEFFFDKRGYIESYTRKLDGVVVEERSNYVSLPMSESHTVEFPVAGITRTKTVLYTDSYKNYIRRIETKDGDRLVEYTEYEYSGPSKTSLPKSYRVGDDDMPVLVEETNNYAKTENIATYDIIRYDENGQNGVRTEYKETYFNATYRIEY